MSDQRRHDQAVRALAMLDVAVRALSDCQLAVIGVYGHLSDDSRAVESATVSAAGLSNRIKHLVRVTGDGTPP